MNIQRDTEYRYGEMSLAPNYNDTSTPNYINKLLRELGTDSLENVVLWDDGQEITYISTNTQADAPVFGVDKIVRKLTEEYDQLKTKVGVTNHVYRTNSIRYALQVNPGQETFDVTKCQNPWRVADVFCESWRDKYIFVTDDLLNQLDGKVKIKYYKEPIPEMEFVDLGLPSGTLWATKNYGAETEADVGLYFAWGESIGYEQNERDFTAQEYKFGAIWPYAQCNQLDNADMAQRFEIGNIYIEGYDNIRTPDKENIDELLNDNYTEWSYEDNYQNLEITGYLITSKINGNSVFFPAAGYRMNGRNYPYSFCSWTMYTDRQESAQYEVRNGLCIYLDGEMMSGSSSFARFIGMPLRFVTNIYESGD